MYFIVNIAHVRLLVLAFFKLQFASLQNITLSLCFRVLGLNKFTTILVD